MSKPCAVIKILCGPDAGRIHRFEEGESLSIGRGRDNDLVIDDPGISRRHCIFFFAEGGVALNDLGSTNGTYVGGQRIDNIKLLEGALVALGTDVTLDFDYVTPQDTAAPTDRDAANGLFTRRAWLRAVQKSGQAGVVARVELRNLGVVSERYGAVVDELLMSFCRSANSLSKDVIAGNWEAESFVFYEPQQSLDGLRAQCQQLCKTLVDQSLALAAEETTSEDGPPPQLAFRISLKRTEPGLDIVKVVEEAVLAPEVAPERHRNPQRRRQSRTSCRIPVWCQTEEQTFPGTVFDIGTGGIGLLTEIDLENGTQLEVRPKEGLVGTVRLQVRWCYERTHVRKYGTGFIDGPDVLRASWVSDALRSLGIHAGASRERRRDARSKGSRAITLQGQLGTYTAIMKDLSLGGLGLEAPLVPALGQRMQLQLGPLKAEVRVTWSRAPRCGVSFEELDQAQLDLIQRMVQQLEGLQDSPTTYSSSRSINVGDTLGHYKIGGLLGEGGVGMVYRGYDTRLLREVAIKVLQTGNLTPQSVERFLQEARAVARVSHPGVVIIHEIVPQPHYYIVMELVQGESLADLIAKGPVPKALAIDIICQVLEALEVVHEAGVIHRDLNTSNILMRPNGQVKVLDFGLAKLSDQVTSLTKAGEVWGTPAYMAPEQIDPRFGPLDGQTDLFAAFCIFFQMLGGRPPFLNETVPKLIFDILYGEPPPLRDLNPEISPELAELVLKGLQKSKEERYRNATEALEALRRVSP